MNKIVLLGDSTLDNKAYTEGNPSVRENLENILSKDSKAILLAVDGSHLQGVYNQLKRIPQDATHLLLSAGGNDALSFSYILHNDSRAYHSVLKELEGIYSNFYREYFRLMQTLVSFHLPFVLSTIYEGAFGDPVEQKKANAALTGFNDAIIRSAVRYGLPVIDLRSVCSEPEHFRQRIEPSALGGTRFAKLIKYVLEHHNFNDDGTKIYCYQS